MFYKQIVVCFLFFSGQTLCMLVDAVKPEIFTQEQGDVWPIIINKCDFPSYIQFSKTCTYLYEKYNTQAYMKKMMLASQKGNKEQVKLLLSCETEFQKKRREKIVACFFLSVKCSIKAEVLDAEFAAVKIHKEKKIVGYSDPTVVMEIYGKKYDPQCECLEEITRISFYDLLRRPELCWLILEQGLSPNIYSKKCEDKHTLLISAICNRNHQVAKLLLAHENFDLKKHNKPDEEEIVWTPLRYAIMEGDVEAVGLLLKDKRVEPNKEEKGGWTPLKDAILKGKPEIVDLLLKDKRVDPNKKDKAGLTLLMWAIAKGNAAIVKLLLAHEKIDPNKRNIFGETPLLYAVNNGNINLVEILLDNSNVTTNLFWYNLSSYISRNPNFNDLFSRCTSPIAKCLYWYGRIAGCLRRNIFDSAAINSMDVMLDTVGLFAVSVLGLAGLTACIAAGIYINKQ